MKSGFNTFPSSISFAWKSNFRRHVSFVYRLKNWGIWSRFVCQFCLNVERKDKFTEGLNHIDFTFNSPWPPLPERVFLAKIMLKDAQIEMTRFDTKFVNHRNCHIWSKMAHYGPKIANRVKSGQVWSQNDPLGSRKDKKEVPKWSVEN